MKEIAQKRMITALVVFLSFSLLQAQMPPFGARQGNLPPEQPHHGRHSEDHYRGRRMMTEQEGERDSALFAERITVKESHNFTAIIIFFNLPLDPLSVKKENISIGEIPVGTQTAVKFSRMGDMMQILIPDEEQKLPEVFDLRLDSILSFNGLPLEKSQFRIQKNKPYLVTE